MVRRWSNNKATGDTMRTKEYRKKRKRQGSCIRPAWGVGIAHDKHAVNPG